MKKYVRLFEYKKSKAIPIVSTGMSKEDKEKLRGLMRNSSSLFDFEVLTKMKFPIGKFTKSLNDIRKIEGRKHDSVDTFNYGIIYGHTRKNKNTYYCYMNEKIIDRFIDEFGGNEGWTKDSKIPIKGTNLFILINPKWEKELEEEHE